MIRPFMSSEGRSTTETDDVLGGRALDGAGHDLPGRGGGLLPGFLLDPPDGADGLELGLVLDPLDQHGLGLFLGHPGYPLELFHGLLDGLGDLRFLDFEVLFLLGEAALLLGKILFLPLHRLEPPLQVLLLAEEPALGLVELALLFPVLGLEFVLPGQVFLAGLEGRFPLDLFPFFPGLGDDRPGFLLGFDGPARTILALEQEDDDRPQENGDNGDADVTDRIHRMTSSSI
jgi:hypothetical protein